jgi:hypothetical protein
MSTVNHDNGNENKNNDDDEEGVKKASMLV